MNANDYWLLDSVLEQKHSLSLLGMENVEAIFDRPPHGMDRETLLQHLKPHFKIGLLIASSEERGDFVPTHDEITQGLDGALDYEYGLTAAGGAEWESVSRPNWNCFVDGVFGEDASESEDSLRRERAGSFSCVDRSYLEKFMEGLHYRGIAPHAPSLKWDTVSPWNALYWKTLPSAHRVRFFGVQAPIWPEDRIPEEYRGMGEWRTTPEFAESITE